MTMKKTYMAFFLSVLFPLACGPVQDTDTEQQLARSEQALLSLDSSALAAHQPTGLLPAQRLARGAFDVATLRQNLLQTGEAFEAHAMSGARTAYEGTSWTLEMDPTHGKVLALRKTPPPMQAAVAQNELALASRAAARLQAWGIPSEELGQGMSRRVKAQSMREREEPSAAEVQSYKTFFFRTVDGVRVAGHRAVISHGADGSFYRALVKWPPLASSGHRLRTSLKVADIEGRARGLLDKEGIATGEARLYWQYHPTELPGGEVVLTLQALLRVDSAKLGEPRLYEVDVDAEP